MFSVMLSLFLVWQPEEVRPLKTPQRRRAPRRKFLLRASSSSHLIRCSDCGHVWSVRCGRCHSRGSIELYEVWVLEEEG